MWNRPGRDRQELAAVRVDREGQALPEGFGDERHDRMQQSQRPVEGMSENGARDFTVVTGSANAPFGRLEVPISEIVPDETPGGLGVFAEAKPAVAFFGPPLSFLGARGSQRGIALEDGGVET